MDIEKLSHQYIIIKAKGVSGLESLENLRELDNELEAGIKALYDDDAETIVAFLFNKAKYNDEQAAAWIEEAKKAGIGWSLKVPMRMPAGTPVALSCFLPAAPAVQAAAVEEMSFGEIVTLLTEALDGEGVEIDGRYRWPWLVDIYPELVVVEVSGRLYRATYTMNEETNALQFGEFEEVRRVYVPAAMAGNGTANVFTLTLNSVPDTLADSLRAEATDADADLVWKEIFRVSTTFRPDAGTVLIVKPDMVQAIYDSFQGGAMTDVPITATSHFWEEGGYVPAKDTLGFIKDMVLADGHLYAALEVIDPDARAMIDDGRVKDCSIYAVSEHADNRTGKVWDWVLLHLLLTNYPQITDMDPFGQAPDLSASKAGGIIHYTEVPMPQDTNTQTPAPEALSEEDRALLAQARSLQAQGVNIAGIQEQAKALRTQARNLEVSSLVAAFEGTAPRDDVKQIEGRRHYPSVVSAAEQMLREGVAFDSVGQNGRSPADAIVLRVLNALPTEARMPIEQPKTPDRNLEGEAQPAQDPHRTTPLSAEQYRQLPDEAIDALTLSIKH